MLYLIDEKNMHELLQLLKDRGADSAKLERFLSISSVSGSPAHVTASLKKLGVNAQDIETLSDIAETFKQLGLEDMLRIDLSQDCGTKYYSGVVFKGYVKGIPSAVLSGGRYDALMHRMGKKYGAIGFALYTDLLERFSEVSEGTDADTVIIYGKDIPASEVLARAQALSSEGKKVRALKKLPGDLTYDSLVDLTKGGGK